MQTSNEMQESPGKRTQIAQAALCIFALLMMAACCVGVGLSVGIGHTVLTVLFAVLAMVFYNLSRWHKVRAEAE